MYAFNDDIEFLKRENLKIVSLHVCSMKISLSMGLKRKSIPFIRTWEHDTGIPNRSRTEFYVSRRNQPRTIEAAAAGVRLLLLMTFIQAPATAGTSKLVFCW